MKIYIVRHGQDLSSAPGLLTDKDVSLSDTGIQQAKDCAHGLKQVIGTVEQAVIFSSPLQRTSQTAQYIVQELGLVQSAIHVDDRLTERDYTAYTGQSIATVFSQSEEDLVNGGMEPYASLFNRLEEFYAELTNKYPDTLIIIVTHSGNIRPLFQIAKHLPADPLQPIPEFTPDTFMKLG